MLEKASSRLKHYESVSNQRKSYNLLQVFSPLSDTLKMFHVYFSWYNLYLNYLLFV